jgi:Holliday junction resolvasome RuvABC ATP-dependent DNA helicase subunit
MANAARTGTNFNILLRAPSGYGKTTVGLLASSLFIGNNYRNAEYIVPNAEGHVKILTERRLHFIDEVHLLKDPELLYPVMDSGRYIFILATNADGNLVEPLVNRCIHLIFMDYSDEELIEIIRANYPGVSMLVATEIVSNSHGNPRVAKVLANRLSIIIGKGILEDVENVRLIIRTVLQIQGGLDIMQRRYLQHLQIVERSSLESIAHALHVDKSTILRDIEPALIYKHLIKISSRGRELIGG